ncbi:DNA internalization-related competence protein ComEC/Rec2 [Alkalibaculum sp. M08DMB]|uniref:DNA internalization-related competence protein ComEC/Rec2 n=1 Tax=Alkalibaculum sporogenes TaxID=2655001 RepID=A0A6A7K5S9_9FIRM|nr:DNA internalization-related competence protein ComEC/Rec2 [Alkalibaculum sporogenes]MPW24627.1 DNA internalization-related competence protein ComEC/Rec2 [Alkalibaculum sporogenes]
MKRLPLFFFISGLLAIISYNIGINLILACVVFAIAFCICKGDSYKLIVIYCSIIFIFIFCRMDNISNITSSFDLNKNEVQYQGRVVSFPIYKENKVQFVMEVKGAKKEKVQGFINNNTHLLTYGDMIEFTAQATIPNSRRNPGGFDYRQYLRTKKIYTVMYINNDSLVIQNNSQNIISKNISALRNKLTDFIDVNFTERENQFLRALIIGEKGNDSEVINNFNKLGISHILSVSGLHVGFIYLFATTICRILKLNKKIQIYIIGISLYTYCFIVGFSDSVIRASLMLFLLLLANITNKKYDTLNVLCFLALCFILHNPYVIYSVGFQLSYSAVLSITVFYPYLNNKISFNTKYLEYFKSIILITISVQIGTIPLVIYHFNNISIFSLITNLLIVPAAGFIVIVFLCVFCVSTLLNISLLPFLVPVKLSINFILSVSENLIKIPYSYSILSPMPFYIVSFYYLLVFICFGYLYHYRLRNRKVIIVVTIINISIVIILSIIPKPLTVTYLDVGQGDSALIQFPSGQNMLIDGGGQYNYSVGDEIIINTLVHKNIRKLDLVVCTHSHDDHKLGILEIIGKVKIDSIIINCLEEEGYTDLISLANEFNIPVYKNNQVKVNISKSILLDFVYPNSNTLYIDENNSSVITKMSYNDISFLFMGDLENKGEKNLIENKKDISSVFLKIGHHGSKTSTGKEFLSTVNPVYGIISVGKDNRYNHPNQEVLELLDNKGVNYFRTDQVGAIEINTNGEKVKIKTYTD